MFFDVVEPVFEFRLNENNGTDTHLDVVGADLHAGASSDDVIQLVLEVRFLRVGATFWQNVNASAHGGDTEKFEVEFAACVPLAAEIVDVEVMRHKAPVRSSRLPVGPVETRRAWFALRMESRDLSSRDRQLTHCSVKKDVGKLLDQSVSGQRAVGLIPLVNPVNHAEQGKRGSAGRD